MEGQRGILQRNIKLLYALNFFINSEFLLPIMILFGHEYLGLSYLQAGSFFLVAWFVSIGFDFIGGTIADRLGRKEIYLCGMWLQIASYIPFLVTKSYAFLIFSSVIYGIGLAFSSNSVDALVYEQSVELGAQKDYQRANANSQIFTFVGRVYASILGGLSYKLDPRLPYLLYIAVLVLALLAGKAMKIKKSFTYDVPVSYAETLRAAFRVYRKNHRLTQFIIIGGFVDLWSNLLFSYYQPFFIDLRVSSLTLGVLFSGISVASAVGSYLMRHLPDRLSAHAIQSVELIGILATGICLLLLRLPLLLAAPLFAAVVAGFLYPTLRLYVNGHADNSVRASVLSLATTAFSIGAGLGFLFSYFMADHVAPRFVLGLVVVGAVITLLANLLNKQSAPAPPRERKRSAYAERFHASSMVGRT